MANTTPKTNANPAVPAFEFFQGTLSESSSTPQITIRKGGLMVLTAAAAEFLGENATHVQLAYDRPTGTVGIRAAGEGDTGAYLLRNQAKSPNRLVGGKRFFTYNGIPTDEAVTFDVIDYGNHLIGFKLTAEPAKSGSSKAA